MSMNRKTIEESIKQAREFIVAGQAAIERLDFEKSGYGYRDEENWRPQAHDRFITGSAESGNLRRRSMDLTRKLAELRKY
jgi:hypothetical protein